MGRRPDENTPLGDLFRSIAGGSPTSYLTREQLAELAESMEQVRKADRAVVERLLGEQAPVMPQKNPKCLEAHVLEATVTRYADGKVIGTCSICFDRVELPREVGDVTGRLRGLIQGLTADTRTVSWTLEEFRALVAEVDDVEREVGECRSMIELAGDLLKEKFHLEEADLRGDQR